MVIFLSRLVEVMMNKNLFFSWLTLFSSLGTLVCCALPSLFIMLGMGATFAGLIGTFPQLIWISEHKLAIFILSGILISLSLLWLYAVRNRPCPIDPDQARACKVSRKWSIWLSGFSFVVWAIGFTTAFLL